jgi:spoIIIJ-associated protein
MSSADRRIVHTTLAEDGSVSTHSEGEEPDRHVVITPRKTTSSGAMSSGRQHGRLGPHTTNNTTNNIR